MYSLPLIMGPLFDQKSRPARCYGKAESIALTCRTDRDAVARLIPDCFRVPDKATVTALFGDYDLVDFMAGGGYRVAYVGVSARFEGDEVVDGLYILVMWENRTVPIVSGHEMIGIPKMHADITAVRSLEGGGLRATAAVWGHEVMRLEIAEGKEQNFVVRRTAQKRVNETPWLGYKYVPSFDGPPDVSYPMVVWNEAELEELSLSDRGSVTFGGADESDLGPPAAITRALRTIPIGDVVFASHSRGAGKLRLDKSRRLT